MAVRIKDESKIQFCTDVYKCAIPKKCSFKENDTENSVLFIRLRDFDLNLPENSINRSHRTQTAARERSTRQVAEVQINDFDRLFFMDSFKSKSCFIFWINICNQFWTILIK